MINSVIAQALLKSSRCIVPNFIDSQIVQLLREDLQSRETSNLFVRAGTGKGEREKKSDLIRGDSISWLDEPSANSTQKHLWEKLTSLKLTLNRELWLGISTFEGHYASYPAGGFYKRHLDSFKTDDARVVTVVIYLNEHWQESDGGKLRIHSQPPCEDISPIAGTLACFLSRELEHEVLLSQALRLSFTGWFKTTTQ